MKYFRTILFTLGLVVLLLGACVPVTARPTATEAATEAATADITPAQGADWQTYTDAGVGYSITTPPDWNQQPLPDQADGAIHGMGFSGPQGGVDVYWGTGFGGACPSGTVPVQVNGEELPACYTANDDGTEVWSQIGYQVSGGSSFSVRAYTSNAEPASHDLVLQVLATLTFMPSAQAPTQTGSANPASENCVAQGGTLTITERGDGGQYGICMFEDNRQCEEWALLRGDCPVGGIKVTGYVTPAATYCAITGGEYNVTANSGQADEQGTCTFKNGTTCDASEYYNGKCQAQGG
jgi:putative hemolysin